MNQTSTRPSDRLRRVTAAVSVVPRRDAARRGLAATATLRVIPRPAPGTRTVLMKASAPVFAGTGAISYVCGACGIVLVRDSSGTQMRDFVVRCPGCGSYNEVS